MPALGRRPLEFYATMDSSQSSPSSGSSRTPDSPRVLRQRSKSPKKQPSPSSLYPTEDLHRVSNEFDPVFTRRSADPLYPHLDRDQSAGYVEESAVRRSYGNNAGDDIARTPGRSSPPVRPARKNKLAANLDDLDGSGDRVRGEGVTDVNNPLLWTILGFTLLAVCITIFWPYLGGLPALWRQYTTPTAEESALERFEDKFRELETDFKDDVHPDSLKILHNALEHHVRTMSDTKRTYPTCVLIAGDTAGVDNLNCLAERVASIIPPTAGKTPKEFVHVVNLKDEHHEHKNPDTEDRRSRVHTGINQGISEGAKIILFQNVESLIPDDIPLLQLFYSYCDGENPTFPKTLWILTVGTSNVTFLEGLEGEQEHPGFAKTARRKVEDFLEKILSTVRKVEEGVEEKVESITRNPILTRIANYIVPVLRTKKSAEQCKVSDRGS